MNCSWRLNFTRLLTLTETVEDSSGTTGRYRENDPSRCPVDDQPLSELECTDGAQGCVLRNNGHPVEPLAEQGTSEQEQQLDYQDNDEHGDKETDQTVGKGTNGEEQQPSYQQELGAHQVNGWSLPVLEMEQMADQAANAHQRPPFYQQTDGRSGSGSNYSLLNGVETSEASCSFQETEPVADQLVNHSGLQRQTLYQQGGSAEANGLNHPTQLPDLRESQRPDRPEYQPPYPEEGDDQPSGCNYPVQETGQVAGQLPDEHEDFPPGHQLVDGAHINGVSSTGQTEHAMEHSCSSQELRLWNQKLIRSIQAKETKEASRNKMNQRETYFIQEISEVQQLCQVDANGVATAFFSCAIYTDSYEYKLGVRMYLNGVGDGSGRYVAIFIHMMKGKYDFRVGWPFNRRITISILDQSGAKCHISQSMQAEPTLSAFQKPTEAICRTGCGFVKFASIDEVFSPQYVKDGKIFLQIEFSD